MTREHAKQLLPIIKAWSEGAEIQVQVCGSTPPQWVMLDENSAFTSHPVAYRIKPQPREWWIVEGGNWVYTSKETATNHRPLNAPIIHVREVTP